MTHVQQRVSRQSQKTGILPDKQSRRARKEAWHHAGPLSFALAAAGVRACRFTSWRLVAALVCLEIPAQRAEEFRIADLGASHRERAAHGDAHALAEQEAEAQGHVIN